MDNKLMKTRSTRNNHIKTKMEKNRKFKNNKDSISEDYFSNIEIKRVTFKERFRENYKNFIIYMMAGIDVVLVFVLLTLLM